MDNFEKHIREHASQFDDHKADRAKLWANISVELENETPKVIPFWKSPLLKIAASLLILLGIGSFIAIAVSGGDPNGNTQYVSKELLDIDTHYKNLVSYQVRLVESNPNLSDNDKDEFLSFMDELDAEYETLRLEMQNNLDNEQVLAAIVANYKKRIELIENLLEQLNNAKIQEEEYGYTL
ncbi:hypothetical protein [uncultured Croceitalea sp.]|uniref:hypothetical protein n=1 Tax=uncultured Croceitalea sp. TaxID=1798908 RepID=UPI003305A135